MRYPDGNDFPTGPAIGERLPAIVLPDQSGTPVDVEAVRGEGRALVVFHRSVRW
jgi:peroxiredoxin